MKPTHPATPEMPESDRAAIIDLVNRFGWTIDSRDWDGYEALFDDEVRFDYSAIDGPTGTLSPADIREGGYHELGGFDHTQHAITNHVVTLDGDRARCEAHFRAMHVLRDVEPGLLTDGETWFENGGHYSAGLVRRADGWRIADWTFSLYWSRGNGGLFKAARARQQ